MDENASLFFPQLCLGNSFFFLLRRSLHRTPHSRPWKISNITFFPFPDLTVRMLRPDDSASDIELPGSLSAADPRLHLVRKRFLCTTYLANVPFRIYHILLCRILYLK